MSKTILEIKNVSKSFGKTKVVNNLSFEVKDGEILGFLGPNGAGKTTTIKMIVENNLYIGEESGDNSDLTLTINTSNEGIQAEIIEIYSGNITINGFDVRKNFEKAMQYIGGIVENPDMYGYMSAVDNLKLHAKIRGVNYSEVYKTLELVGLQKSMNQKVSKYSLGMKQRAGLALSLLHSPKVLILDEPTNGLDPVGIKDLRDILKRLASEKGIAVLVSSHILSEMELMCDRVVVINEGKFVKTQSLSNVEENEEATVKYEIKVKQIEISKIETLELKEEKKDILIQEVEPLLIEVTDKDKFDKCEKAKQVLHDKMNKDVSVDGNKICITLKRSEISRAIKTLVLDDIDVESASECENTLENMFFDVTKGEKKDE